MSYPPGVTQWHVDYYAGGYDEPRDEEEEEPMGACNFETIGRGKTAEQAFDAARDRAAYDRGHAGYTGTIAEKDGFVIIQSKPLTREDAWKLACQLMHDSDPRINDKWGPAGCIKLDKDGEFLFFGWASS